MMKYVLFYDSADDVLTRAPAHFEAHTARGKDFHDRGSLLMYGPFGDPQREGSMAVFASREAAEEFATNDPFVLNGVVRDWHIRAWDEGSSKANEAPPRVAPHPTRGVPALPVLSGSALDLPAGWWELTIARGRNYREPSRARS